MSEPPGWNALKERLSRSRFRSRFQLGTAELRMIAENGWEKTEHQCRKFILTRLAPAEPLHDGRQTPMRGHPCFIAQHATGCCCRSCLSKWHGIPAGKALSAAETAYLVSVLMAWLHEHASGAENFPHTPDLF